MRKYILCGMWAVAMAQAEMAWDQTEVSLQVHPTQVSAEAVFAFTNTGAEPVSLPRIEITCGCLSAKPLKPSYAPGESGKLAVVFNLRNRTGKQHKELVVHAGDGSRTILSIAVDIPEAYEADAELIRWGKDDASTEKRISLRNPNPMPIKLLSIDSSNTFLPAELTTIREGFEYDVTVTRMPAAANARSVIRIATECPPGVEVSKSINLYVFAQ